MGLVYPDLPTVGQPNSTEQPKVRQSLIDLRDTINGAVDTDNLATGAVTTVKLDDDAVTAAKLADDAVVTASILDDAVTPAKMSLSALSYSQSADKAHTGGGAYETMTGLTSATLVSGATYLITLDAVFEADSAQAWEVDLYYGVGSSMDVMKSLKSATGSGQRIAVSISKVYTMASATVVGAMAKCLSGSTAVISQTESRLSVLRIS